MSVATKTKAGSVIEITSRHVGDKVQPHIRIGSRYLVERIETRQEEKRPEYVAIVRHPKRKGATLRVSRKRFGWRSVSNAELREYQFEQACSEGARQLDSQMTPEEQMQIAIMPLILNHIAWVFALRAADKAVYYRVDILKNLTRAVRQTRREYEYQLRRDLQSICIQSIEEQTMAFLQMVKNDMVVFYFTVNRAFKKAMPDYPYDDLRSCALVAVLIMAYAEKHNAQMDELIRRKLGQNSDTITNPLMRSLKFLMQGMAGEVGKFNYEDPDIQLCIKIFANKLKRIKFNI